MDYTKWLIDYNMILGLTKLLPSWDLLAWS